MNELIDDLMNKPSYNSRHWIRTLAILKPSTLPRPHTKDVTKDYMYIIFIDTHNIESDQC